jgi:hypothetical protein
VGEDREYSMGKSFTEGNMSFGGRTARSPEVAAAMLREGRRNKERRRGRKKARSNRYSPKGISFLGALL